MAAAAATQASQIAESAAIAADVKRRSAVSYVWMPGDPRDIHGVRARCRLYLRRVLCNEAEAVAAEKRLFAEGCKQTDGEGSAAGTGANTGVASGLADSEPEAVAAYMISARRLMWRNRHRVRERGGRALPYPRPEDESDESDGGQGEDM